MDRINKVQKSKSIIKQQAVTLQRAKQRLAQQVASQRSLRFFQDSGFNMVSIRRNFKTFEERISKRMLSKSQNADEDLEFIEEVKKSEETASRFNKKNFELKTKTLLILRDTINDDDSVEDILRKVLDFYPDYTLADDALDFLLLTSKGKLAEKVLIAKDFLNENYKREIIAGRNINFQAQTFSKEGLGSPTALRDMYRDITGNPKTPHTLFEELSSKFDYNNMKVVMRFLLHSLGADIKSKGPSITRPELLRYMEDIQMLQAILGVYRFFKSRSSLISNQFDHFGLVLPKTINFETLSKLFIELLKEKYFSSDKILSLGKTLGILRSIIAQIIIYTQMRDAIRNTSSRLYKSKKKRQEALDSFIETLEELEEELEEED